MARFIPTRRTFGSLLAAALFLIGSASLLFAGDESGRIAAGIGNFTFVDSKGNADKPITVWYYRPENFGPQTPIVFVMHGVKRNGKEYRDAWVSLAQQHGFLLLCPEFSEPNYPSSAYQRGNIFDGNNRPIPKEKWTFSAIEHLFDYAKSNTNNSSERYYIYGHSAGAQFVHRFVLFLPNARYARAIAANPGWYTMPDFVEKFPYGLKDSGQTRDNLKVAFGRDFAVLLGDNDTNGNDENLQQSPKAELQGHNRLERGHKFYEIAQQSAKQLNVPLLWREQEVAGAGHSNRQMEASAVALFFPVNP